MIKLNIKSILAPIAFIAMLVIPTLLPMTVMAAQDPGNGGSGGGAVTNTTVTKGDAAEKTSFSFGSCGTAKVGIKCLMVEVLKFLSVAVGIAVVGGIAAGGIVYSTAEGNPGKAQKGITIITNAVLGLVLYLLMFAIINFLVPGGVL